MILTLKVKNKKSTLKPGKKLNKQKDESYHVLVAANAAEEKKAENILLLDVSKLTIIADFFLIITAKSPAQIEAITNSIKEKLSKYNYNLNSKEGFITSNWVILDFGNLVVHIMGEKERNYYKLERFWSNATVIDKKIWRKAS